MQTYLTHKNKHKEASKKGRKRNKSQIKEQENPPQQELNKRAESNLSNIEFRVMIIRILNSMKKDIEAIKEDQQK